MGYKLGRETRQIRTSKNTVTIPTRKQKRANHQNSDLFALPRKTKYFLKQVSTDFLKFITQSN